MFMLKSTHEALIAKAREEEADTVRDLEAKFKKAVKDIAAQADEIANLKSTFNQRLADAVQDYQADAEAMRAKRKRDRDLKAEKAKAAAAPKAASKKAAR